MRGNKFTYFRFIPLLALLFCMNNAMALPHPFHVSLTEIRMNTGKGNVEVSCRMFTDDLQQAVRKLYISKADLRKTPDDETVNRYVFEYIRSNLSITIGDARISLQWVGYENEEEYTWCYLESTGVMITNAVLVLNTLLFDVNTEQVNMIHCYKDEVRKSTKLDQPENEAVFEF